MDIKKPNGHGGKRPNAGRPLKYGEPVVDATYYVPKSKKPTIDKLVKTQLKQWECKKEINL